MHTHETRRHTHARTHTCMRKLQRESSRVRVYILGLKKPVHEFGMGCIRAKHANATDVVTRQCARLVQKRVVLVLAHLSEIDSTCVVCVCVVCVCVSWVVGNCMRAPQASLGSQSHMHYARTHTDTGLPHGHTSNCSNCDWNT